MRGVFLGGRVFFVLYRDCGPTLEHVAQRDCGDTSPGDVRKLSLDQPALAGSVLSMGVRRGASKGPFQSLLFCDLYVILCILVP